MLRSGSREAVTDSGVLDQALWRGALWVLSSSENDGLMGLPRARVLQLDQAKQTNGSFESLKEKTCHSTNDPGADIAFVTSLLF